MSSLAKGVPEAPYEFLSRCGDGVCVIDAEQRIVLWNDAASRLLGYTAAEAIGRHCYTVFGGIDEAGCVVCRRDCATSRAVRCNEAVPVRDVRVRTRDAGEMWINVSTVTFPASWQELSTLAHLFRSADAQKEVEASYKLMLAELGASDVPYATARSRPIRSGGPLTRREREVLRMLSVGASTKTICAQLGIKPTTTRTHVRNILSKLGVCNRLEAVTLSVRTGLVDFA